MPGTRASLLSFALIASQLTNLAFAQAPFNAGFNDTWNRNYFGFPALVNWIPVFKVGDVINASWSTDWQGNNGINVWCGTPTIYLVQTFNNLEQNGHALLPVLDSWYDPCHLQLVVNDNAGSELGDFNSGAFNINNKTSNNANPTTWAALGPSGAATSFTGGASSAAPTTTAPNTHASKTTGFQQGTASAEAAAASTSNALSSSSDPAATTSVEDKGLSFGAGIGVGIAIMAGVTLIAGLAAWLLYRHRQKKPGEVTNVNPTMDKYAGRPPTEMASVPARVEMPADTYR